MASLDYSERFQTPVFGMSDLDLGMNRWACGGFTYPDQPMDRGKTINATKTCSSKPLVATWTWTATAFPPHLPGRHGPHPLPRDRPQPMGVYSEKPEDYTA